MMKKIFFGLLVLLCSFKCFADSRLKVIEEKVRIRTLPTTKYSEVLDTAYEGDCFEYYCRTSEKVNIAGDEGYWYKIKYADDVAWIFGAYIKLLSENESNVYTTETSKEYLNYLCKIITEKSKRIIRSSTPVKVDIQSSKSNDGTGTFPIECKTYEEDGVLIETYGNALMYVKVSSTFENVFNIKMGMSKSEVEKIIGDADYGFYNGGYLGFEYDKNNRLKSIGINYDLYL